MRAGTPHLRVTDARGWREVPIASPIFRIGRRTAADLSVSDLDVSKEHAEIVRENGAYMLRDCGSRFGTRVNDVRLDAPHALVDGDRIQIGRSAVEIVFVSDANADSGLREATAGGAHLGHLAAILNGLRELGSGRVLDEVLTLVVDSALDVTAAERGFVMLGNSDGVLEPRIARARGRRTLPGTTFRTSERTCRDVYRTGKPNIVRDFREGSLPDAHGKTIALGIRHVLCIPLLVAGHSATGRAPRVIGVLYLDGKKRGALLSDTTRSSLDAFATQAALAIESARLYAEATEKARLEREIRLAATIQHGLLPATELVGPTFDVAAASLPCRTVGGDFFDYAEASTGGFGFALGDVAGKGPSAALLAAAVQSNFAAHAPIAADPADAMTRLNQALLKRAIEARFATMFCGVLGSDGQLAYCNAGQEPPVVVRASGAAEKLDTGGPVLGLLSGATYEVGTVALAPGDLVLVYSDGVTEARDTAGSEFGRERMIAAVSGCHGQPPATVRDQVVAAVTEFARGAPQADDVTVLVLRYRGA